MDGKCGTFFALVCLYPISCPPFVCPRTPGFHMHLMRFDGDQFAAKNPFLWRAVFEFTRFPPARYVTGELLMLQNFGCFREAMQRYSPDIVVSVHPLCQDLPLKVLESMGPGRA